ncbi:nucleotidyltransferase [Mycoplasma tauri]|uniref:nucleotidyltransferase n=1 Tax=Mycoplasma tauri TaxID=547987 RepID=UPI0019688111|nr:nucleotidyltransferase [Mycoplasma tauri]QSB07641.1 nucleotidyltransferase [Mycoplasma tauri]
MPVGIIAEYNPFHNGHIKQLNWIKEKFPNEKIIVIMTNKVTQRGELAVSSFRLRKKIAKKYGVSKVIKLSFEESTQAAHIFANNAILKLYKKGKIDKLVFGSESNNVENMINIAKILVNNEKSYFAKVREFQKRDKISYPKASALAIKELSGTNFEMPNDILGFEYIKAIVRHNLPIKPYSIKRNVDFHSLETNENYASATLLRKLIYSGKSILNYSPLTFKKIPKQMGDFYHKLQKKIIKYKDKIKKIPVVSEGIENLLAKNIHMPTYDLFIESCTSKRYTKSRIKRILAWILYKL